MSALQINIREKKQCVFYLNPPRPTFAMDMTADESQIIGLSGLRFNKFEYYPMSAMVNKKQRRS